MRGYVGVTDNDWFSFLTQQPGIDEVNFWQPGGSRLFRALQPGEPFLFKLHSPLSFIAGGGFFAHSTILPVSLAWQAFQEKNGASSYLRMKRLIERKRQVTSHFEDYKIGCIILTQPFFFPREQWIPIPPDFSLNIVQGKAYDLTQGHGLHIWEQIRNGSAVANNEITDDYRGIVDPPAGYGSPILVTPRLGQGSFRVMVTDAYESRMQIV